jgi:serine/threonine protein kinase
MANNKNGDVDKTVVTPQPMSDLEILKEHLKPKYSVQEKLGSGGMADVYLGFHNFLKRKVAIKVLPKLFSRDEAMVGRFLKEAESAAQLDHPNIISIYDIGVAGPLNYFIMAYVPGGTLKDRLRRQKRLEVKTACRIVIQLCRALQYAHEKGVIHRDIKPDNIMFDDRDGVILTDFGIAKAKFASKMTATGTLIGTPHYMSPEQLKGMEVDGRSDIYSLGILFYEVLTGRVPFEGEDTYAVGLKHIQEPPEPPINLNKKIPNTLNEIIITMLAKTPNARFAGAAEVEEALAALFDHRDVVDKLTKQTAAMVHEAEETWRLEKSQVEADFKRMKETLEGVKPDVSPPPLDIIEKKAPDEEEERKKAEEERRRREAEEKKKAEEERKRAQAEEKKKAEEERKRAEAEEKKKSEEERKKREVEETKRKEEEEKRREEEEIRRQQEEEERRAREQEKRIREEEERQRREEEKLRKLEEKQRIEEEKKRRAEEAQQIKEQKKAEKEALKKQEEEEKRRREEEKRLAEPEEEQVAAFYKEKKSKLPLFIGLGAVVIVAVAVSAAIIIPMLGGGGKIGEKEPVGISSSLAATLDAGRLIFIEATPTSKKLNVLEDYDSSPEEMLENPAILKDSSGITEIAYSAASGLFFAVKGDGSIQTLDSKGNLIDTIQAPPRRAGENPVDTAWAPKGDMLTFVRKVAGKSQLWVVELNAQGKSDSEQIIETAADIISPAFNPLDDEKITFGLYDPQTAGTNIINIDLDRRRTELQHKVDGRISGLKWSPDGRMLAYTVQSGAAFDIYLLNISEKKSEPLTKGAASEKLFFSPDGRYVIFTADDDGRSVLKAVSTDGGDAELFLEADSSDGTLTPIGWKNK